MTTMTIHGVTITMTADGRLVIRAETLVSPAQAITIADALEGAAIAQASENYRGGVAPHEDSDARTRQP